MGKKGRKKDDRSQINRDLEAKVGKQEIEKKAERDKKGQYKKGWKGGPGRKKGDVKDLLFANGKKRTTEALIDDLLATYTKLGSNKFLYKWALESKGNLKKFLDILFKFAPLPKTVDSTLASEEPMKVTVQTIITDRRPMEADEMSRIDELEKKMAYMQGELQAKNAEIKQLRMLVDDEVIDHEPIELTALPEHSEEDEEKIGRLKEKKAELQRQLREKEGKG